MGADQIHPWLWGCESRSKESYQMRARQVREGLPGAKGTAARLPRTNSLVPCAACGRRSMDAPCMHAARLHPHTMHLRVQDQRIGESPCITAQHIANNDIRDIGPTVRQASVSGLHLSALNLHLSGAHVSILVRQGRLEHH